LVEVRDALLDAFPSSPIEIDILAASAGLKKNLSNYLAGAAAAYDTGLFNYLQWVNAQRLMTRLLKEATKEAPGNPELAKVMAKVSTLEREFASFRPLADDGRSLALEEAEALVLKHVTFENVGPWLEKLGKMRRAVCRIEPQPEPNRAGYGTGYLVARDVIMTNFHVAEPFWDKLNRAKRVRVRFDYETAAGGVGVSGGKEYSLRTKWPAGEAATAERRQPWQCLCSPETELDFALLQLNGPAASDQVGGAARSFLNLTSRPFNCTDPMMILQHPAGDPMKLSFGAVSQLEPPSKVRYKVNTQGGSSGSPCLTQDLAVTAIHHFRVDDQNRAVTHEAILSFLKQGNNPQQLQASGLELKEVNTGEYQLAKAP
ncbi:MAG TPA: trypsin-like peptidase domain-containing protein, partial [Gemmataceae bacterium]